MLVGKKCKVGNRWNHDHKDFEFYEGIICSEPFLSEPEEVRLLVLREGKLVTVDTFLIYDITDPGDASEKRSTHWSEE